MGRKRTIQNIVDLTSPVKDGQDPIKKKENSPRKLNENLETDNVAMITIRVKTQQMIIPDDADNNRELLLVTTEDVQEEKEKESSPPGKQRKRTLNDDNEYGPYSTDVVNEEVKISLETAAIEEEAETEILLPLRKWQVEISLLNGKKKEINASIFSSCTYHLHPTFEIPIRTIETPPFLLEEQGWGEFQFEIVCNLIDNAGNFKIIHDLSFEDDAYIVEYSAYIPYDNPKIRDFLIENSIIEDDIDHDHEKLTLKKPNPSELAWTNKIPLLNEEIVQNITNLILENSAVQKQVNRYPRKETFVMTLSQLPDDLLSTIQEYVLTGKLEPEETPDSQPE